MWPERQSILAQGCSFSVFFLFLRWDTVDHLQGPSDKIKKGKITTFQFWWDKVVRPWGVPPLADNVTPTQLRWKRRPYHSVLVFQFQGILYGEGGDVAADDTEEATTLTWAAGGVERDESKKKTEHRTERRGHVTWP